MQRPNFAALCLLSSVAFLVGCADGPEARPAMETLGRYAGHYDAVLGTFEIHALPGSAKDVATGARALTYANTTGLSSSPCAIRDTTKNANDLNWCMGLVDPDSCDPNYNSATKTLTLAARLANKSNLANDGSPYVYENPAFVPNTTFYAPFYFKLVGLDWATYPAALVTTVNTNLRDAQCGGKGLSLLFNDLDGDKYFDCIYPDQAYAASDNPIDPGWNLTPMAGASLAPGAETQCDAFMQFGLLANESFTLYFDVLAVKDDGALPAAPGVAAPANNAYVNAASVTVSGSCQVGATVFIEGGNAAGAYPASGICDGAAAYSISVPLNLNAANDLVIYQVSAGKQGPGVARRVTHDNVAPTVVNASPPNGQMDVSIHADCLLTFSEPMKASTFASGTNCTNGTFRICRSTTFVAGTVSFSADQTQAKYAPTATNLNASATHTCVARAGVTDLAGNALGADYTTTFRTFANSGFYEDDAKASILSAYPPDNARDVDVGVRPRIRFSEPMRKDTLVDAAGVPVITATCSDSVPAISMFALGTCDGTAQAAAVVAGSGALSADGTELVFYPSAPLTADRCYGYAVSDCVRDLAGERMALQGTATIPGYADTLRYTMLHRFRTATDAAKPTLAGIFPVLGQAGVARYAMPLLIFDEAIDDTTFGTDSVFLNVVGDPAPRAIATRVDPFQQVGFVHQLAPLALASTNLLSLDNGVADYDGNTLDPQTSQFEADASGDSTAPTVARAVPANGVSTGTLCPAIDVVFSEPVDPATVNELNVQLLRVGDGARKPVHIALDDHRHRITLTPLSSLVDGDQLRATISGVKDFAGNAMSATFDANTFTVTEPSTTPTVAAVYPPTGATIPRNQTIAVTFSEPMDRSTLMDTRYTGLGCTPIVETSADGRTIFLNCMNLLAAGARTLTVNRNVRALTASGDGPCQAGGGARMDANYGPASYTVSAAIDTTAPTVAAVIPADGATSVSTAVIVQVSFDEPVDARTVKPTTLFLVDASGRAVPVDYAFAADYRTVDLRPVSALAASAIYRVVGTTAIRDLAGGNAYDGLGAETAPKAGILQTCFSTGVTACP